LLHFNFLTFLFKRRRRLSLHQLLIILWLQIFLKLKKWHCGSVATDDDFWNIFILRKEK
jgi:hypothetical protein